MLPPSKSILTTCTQCGAALSSDILEGLCPHCLAASVGDQSDQGAATDGYELLNEIGRGGMGVVYLARQRQLDRLVAVKILLAGTYAGEEAERRFLREAREAARLHHPNIVAVHDVGRRDGHPFYAMDLIEGEDLAAYVQHHRPDARHAAQLVATAAHAVQHAHDNGVLHRDLKPTNLIIDTNGVPHLTDFGLATAVEGGDGLTRTGEVMGSPGYIAPEQLRGESTVASDVYGLGAVLYHSLTGRAPFVAARLPELLAAVEAGAPLPPRRLDASLPRDLDTIALRALSREPAHRYRTARDLAADLERWLAGKPIAARPISPAERLWSWARRNKKLSLLTAALGFTAIMGTTGIVTQWRRAERAALDSTINLYSADLRVASDALLAGDLGLARRTLSDCPPARRDIVWGLLWPMARGKAESEIGRARWTVTHIAVSRDGAFAATTSQADNVRLWDLNAGRLIAELPETMTSWWAAFSPDGSTLFTADTTVKQWDVARRMVVRGFPGLSGALSPDGKTLYTCTGHRFVWEGNPGAVFAWNVADGTSLFEIKTTSRVIAVSPDGDTLAVSDAASSISLYNAHNGRMITKPWPSIERLWNLEFSPDGASLIASGWSPRVRIWSLNDVSVSPHILPHPLGTWETAYSPDGRLLAVGCSDRQVHIWDAQTWKEVQTLRGHDNEVWSVAWQPDGRLLSSGRDPRLLRWRTDMPRKETPLHQDENSLSVVWLTGERIASVHISPGGDRAAVVASVLDPRQETTFPGETPLAFDRNTNRLWLWTAPHTLRARLASDLADTIQVDWPELPGESMVGLPSVTVAAGLAWAALTDGTLIIHRLRDGQRVARFEKIFTQPRPVGALSPDGRRFVWGGASTELFILDLESGQRTRLEGHRYDVDSIAFAPDGKSFATGGTDGLLYLWQTDGAHARRALGQHLTSVNQLAFSADGKVLISHEAGVGLHLWHIDTGREVAFIEVRDEGFGEWLGLSPDGRWLGLRKISGELRIFPIASRDGGVR